MKILKYILPLLFVGFLSQSCKKSYLDKDPLGQQTDQNFYNDPANAILAVNSIYDAVSWEEGNPATFSNHTYEWMFGDILSDNSEKGSTPSDFLDLADLKSWTAKSSANVVTHATWANMYVAIFRANTTLLNLPNATFTDAALKKRLKGEAFFLRAYCYLNIADKYGAVPLFTKPVQFSEWGKIKRSPLGEVYKQIMTDCDSAANALPPRSNYVAADLGRATKGAALAYKARAMIYQIGTDNANNITWQQVYDVCQQIIQSGEYSLVANYATIFEQEGENNSESIFEIQYGSDNQTWGPIKTGTVSSVFQGNRTTYGWGFNDPTVEFMNSFESTDPRAACTAYKAGDNVYGVLQSMKPSEAPTGYLNRKAALDPVIIAGLTDIKDSPQNKRMFRYADIILIDAEAAAHIGKESEALTMLNSIRARARNCSKPKGSTAGADDYQPTTGVNLPDISATGQALLDAIYNERRHELGMEALRYFDLVRTGQYLSMLQAKYPDNYAACLSHCIPVGGTVVNPIPTVPIPLSEVTAWGLEQNPGY